MEPKVISSTDLRVNTRDVIESAKFKGQHYIVETFGKPMVAIVGIDEYHRLVALERNLGHSTFKDLADSITTYTSDQDAAKPD